MPGGKKLSFESLALVVNHLVTNGMAWRLVCNTRELQKKHLVTTEMAWCLVSNIDKVSPKTGVFIFVEFVLGKHKNILKSF